MASKFCQQKYGKHFELIEIHKIIMPHFEYAILVKVSCKGINLLLSFGHTEQIVYEFESSRTMK